MPYLTADLGASLASDTAELATDVASTVSESTGALEKMMNSVVGDISLTKIVSAVILLIICALCMKVLMKALERILDRSKVEKSGHTMVKSFVKILLVFVTILLVAGALGIDTTSLLAVLSLAGLAASLALQDSLSNLASGVVILFSKPFKVGDYVTVAGLSGTVAEIGITYTKIITVDAKDILVPNKSITSASIENFSAEDKRRVDLVFTASYDSKPEDLIAALKEAADIPQVLPEEPVFVRISNYADSSIEYTLRVWVRNADYWNAYFAILERALPCYDKHNAVMSYPHINVHTVD